MRGETGEEGEERWEAEEGLRPEERNRWGID